jgi:hypothetical protein
MIGQSLSTIPHPNHRSHILAPFLAAVERAEPMGLESPPVHRDRSALRTILGYSLDGVGMADTDGVYTYVGEYLSHARLLVPVR